MRITYIHQHFKLPTEGGGSRPYEFARRMVLDGHTVTMLCGGEEALDLEFEGIRIKRLAVPYRNAMTTPERIRSFLLFMVKSSFLAVRLKTDVIYASSTPLTVAIPGVIGKFVQRVPLIFEVRDLWPLVPIELGYLRNRAVIWAAQALEKVAYKSADEIVALSPGMKDGILKVAPGKEVTIIPNACDFDFFTQTPEEKQAFRASQGWAPDETIVVYAGGFGPTYRLDWAVQLAATVKEDAIRFVLIGDGTDTAKLRSLAKERGLEPDSILPGLKSKTEAAQYIQAGDIILSSLREDPCLEVNSLNKVFDGLAAGQPIIVNHEGWLKEAIVKADAGWKLDRRIDKAAEQLTAIVKDPRVLKQAGEKGFQLGKSQFDREMLYKKLINLLQEITVNKL